MLLYKSPDLQGRLRVWRVFRGGYSSFSDDGFLLTGLVVWSGWLYMERKLGSFGWAIHESSLLLSLLRSWWWWEREKKSAFSISLVRTRHGKSTGKVSTNKAEREREHNTTRPGDKWTTWHVYSSPEGTHHGGTRTSNIVTFSEERYQQHTFL